MSTYITPKVVAVDNQGQNAPYHFFQNNDAVRSFNEFANGVSLYGNGTYNVPEMLIGESKQRLIRSMFNIDLNSMRDQWLSPQQLCISLNYTAQHLSQITGIQTGECQALLDFFITCAKFGYWAHFC